MAHISEFHAAALNGNLAKLRALLAIPPPIDINFADLEGTTLLHVASYSGHAEVVRELIATPAINVNFANNRGDTALIWAAYFGFTEVIKVLLRARGIMVNQADSEGRTALIRAAGEGHTEVVQELLRAHGINVNHVNQWGNNALMSAAYYGHTAVVKELLRFHGIIINPTNHNGETAIDIASNEEIKALLRNAPAIQEEAARDRRQQQQQQQQQVAAAEEATRSRQQQPPPRPHVVAEASQARNAIMQAVHSLLQNASADIEPPNIPFSVLEHWTESFAEGRLVGSGGFGNVYRGEYVDNERRLYGRVAVKRVSQEFFGASTAFQQQSLQDGAMASMRREITVLRAFKHPNIIKLLGFHMPEGDDRNLSRLCLVYEMASNGSLDHWLTDDVKAARLDWRQRAQIAVGIATALNYLHCHNPGHPAYHRDVKSANIALTVDFCPKLLDCGLAKFIPTGGPMQTVFSRTGQVFGTPGYMCQQYVNTGVYDAKSEVYAFGMVLAELYGGKLQNHEGVSISDEAIEEGDVVPDTRITGDGFSPCPTEPFLSLWKSLCLNSLKSYRKRVPVMMTVVRELRHLSSMHASVATAGVEEELNRLRRELDEVRLERDLEGMRLRLGEDMTQQSQSRVQQEERAQQAQIQQELRERIAEMEERERNRICAICLENPKNVMFGPCNHVAVCSECNVPRVTNCPICRARIVTRNIAFI